MSIRTILAVESSCDDTSVAVLRDERDLLGHVIATQDMHAEYGGIVPEVASREQLRWIDRVAETALDRAELRLEQVDAFAVTAGPGLIGSLLVGVNWTKAVAYALGRPFLGVHHMEAHLLASLLEEDVQPPFISLLVSGGHTLLLQVKAWGRYRLLGQTRDDAAGEAFDKVARLLGLEYPGGPAIERVARRGDPDRHPFPVPMVRGDQDPEGDDYYDMSFAGLKTAVLLRVRELEAQGPVDPEVPHLAASFQRAAVVQLVEKTVRAVQATGSRSVVLGGGVARNRLLASTLRDRLSERSSVYVPSARLATDNAAMVARAARFRFDRGERSSFDMNAEANLPFPGVESV